MRRAFSEATLVPARSPHRLGELKWLRPERRLVLSYAALFRWKSNVLKLDLGVLGDAFNWKDKREDLRRRQQAQSATVRRYCPVALRLLPRLAMLMAHVGL